MSDEGHGVLSVVSVKAFGDFVIACRSLRRIRSGGDGTPEVFAAAHLRPLASAIGFHAVRFMESDGSDDVPAAFDVRRRGVVAALRSLFGLRRQFASRSPRATHYLFDRIGWRERFLAEPNRRSALPDATNIYLAYEAALVDAGYELNDADAARPSRVRSASIFPASRVDAKTIPPQTLRELAAELARAGVNVEAVLLEGDRATVPPDMASRTIARNFEALIDNVRSTDLVISADSLAAHLAEYHDVPCFVVGPRPNTYWLPDTCLSSGAWCLFDDVEPLGKWLRARPPVSLTLV